jgi:hypothetical protein
MLPEILKLLREGGPVTCGAVIALVIISLTVRFVLGLVIVRRARPKTFRRSLRR